MPEPVRDVFALRTSGLEPFLHAEIGREANGSGVTVLSALARQGRDPWDEAAAWAAGSPAAATEGLVQLLAQLPAGATEAGSPVDPRAAAARLVRLLPSRTPGLRPAVKGWARLQALPGGAMLAILLACLVVAGLLNLLAGPSSDGNGPPPGQTMSSPPG